MALRARFRRARLAALGLVVAGCPSCTSEESKSGAGDAGADVSAPDADAGQLPEAAPKDAGEDVYGSDWDDGTVLSDPAVWTPVPDNRDCGLFVANVVPDPFPKREWKTCGPGCLVGDAPLKLTQQNFVQSAGVTASERSGEIFFRLRYGVYGRGTLLVTTRLSDGATIAAAQLRNGGSVCGVYGGAVDSAFLYPINGNPLTRAGMVRGTEPGAPVEWFKWLDFPAVQGSVFTWETGWGMTAGSSIVVNTSASDSKFQTIVKGASEFGVYGRGDLLLWPGGESGGPAVRSYTTKSGEQTLWKTAAGYIQSVAASDDQIAWILVDGPDYPSKYHFNKAELYSSPRATDASGVKASGPVSLAPAEAALADLRVGGGYAAATGCYGGDATKAGCPVFVVQLATGKLWQIPPRPNSGYWGVLAVSATEILVTESDWPQKDNNIHRLVRFRTDSLDALQSAW